MLLSPTLALALLLAAAPSPEVTEEEETALNRASNDVEQASVDLAKGGQYLDAANQLGANADNLKSRAPSKFRVRIELEVEMAAKYREWARLAASPKDPKAFKALMLGRMQPKIASMSLAALSDAEVVQWLKQLTAIDPKAKAFFSRSVQLSLDASSLAEIGTKAIGAKIAQGMQDLGLQMVPKGADVLTVKFSALACTSASMTGTTVNRCALKASWTWATKDVAILGPKESDTTKIGFSPESARQSAVNASAGSIVRAIVFSWLGENSS